MSSSRIEFGKVRLPVKFYRSPHGYFLGVCRGIAESFQLNPTIVRLIWLGATCFYGFGLGLYLALAVSLPRQDRLEKAFDRRILGVCAKIAKKMGWEVGLVRFSAVLLALGSLGFAVLAYVVLYFSFEEEVLG